MLIDSIPSFQTPCQLKSSDLFMKTRYMDEMTTERFGAHVVRFLQR